MKSNLKEKGGEVREIHTVGEKPYETVGVGPWVAPITKSRDADGEWTYRFSLSRVADKGGAEAEEFRPEDVLELPKLAQVLAAALTSDGCLEEDLKYDLECLDSTMSWILGEDGAVLARTLQCSRPLRILRRAVGRVVNYLEEEEGKRFSAEPSEGHVYRDVVLLRAWLKRERREGPVVLGSGRCRICGGNDGLYRIECSGWSACHVHRLRWRGERGVIPLSKAGTAEEWRRNSVLIGDYDVVDPLP